MVGQMVGQRLSVFKRINPFLVVYSRLHLLDVKKKNKLRANYGII